MTDTNVISLREFHNKRKEFYEISEENKKELDLLFLQDYTKKIEEYRLIAHYNKKELKKQRIDKKELKKPLAKQKKKEWSDYSKLCRSLTKDLNLDTDLPKATNFRLLNSYSHYVIDHKISIWFGYKNNIPIENIAHLTNLRWITSKENMLKAFKNYIDDENKWILESLNK